MNYFLYGTQKNLVENFIDEVIKKNDIEEIVKYSLEETQIENILEDASYLNMFGSKKAIVVYNCEKLYSSEEDDNDLEKYLKNPNENTYIFFVLSEEKVNEKKKIGKLLLSSCIAKEFNQLKPYELVKYIQDNLKKDNYIINEEECKRIIYLLNNKLELFDKELEKLKIYKEPGKITMEDINQVISLACRDDVFELVDAVIKNEKQKMFNLYKDLISSGEDPIIIVIMLSNQFRLLLQVKILKENGLYEKDISLHLGIHPYRIKLALQATSNYKKEKLITILKRLIKIDEQIKTTNTPKNTLLETFFLEL